MDGSTGSSKHRPPLVQDGTMTPCQLRRQVDHELLASEREVQRTHSMGAAHRNPRTAGPRVSSGSTEQVEDVSLASYQTPHSVETDPIVVQGELIAEPNEEAIRRQAQMLQEHVNDLRASFALHKN